MINKMLNAAGINTAELIPLLKSIAEKADQYDDRLAAIEEKLTIIDKRLTNMQEGVTNVLDLI